MIGSFKKVKFELAKRFFKAKNIGHYLSKWGCTQKMFVVYFLKIMFRLH